MTGEVKYLYRSWAFVYCRTHLENAGMIVAKSRQVAQVGGSSNQAANAAGGGKAPAVQALAGSRGNPGGGGQRRGNDNSERKMIGKTARIVAVSHCFTLISPPFIFKKN